MRPAPVSSTFRALFVDETLKIAISSSKQGVFVDEMPVAFTGDDGTKDLRRKPLGYCEK